MHELSEDEIRALQLEFCTEAVERLDGCEALLLNSDIFSNPEQIKDLKRQLHGLKGSSNAVGMSEFGKLAHEMESKLLQTGAGSVDELLADVDTLRRFVAQILDGKS